MYRLCLRACVCLVAVAQIQAVEYDTSSTQVAEALAADDQCDGDCAVAALQLSARSSATPSRGCADGKCDCAKEFLAAFEQVDRESPTFAEDVHKALYLHIQDGNQAALACKQQLQELLEPKGTSIGGGYGVNAATGWEYSLVDDCFRSGGKCPEGQYCQTFSREQWFPYSESYVNRGRCVHFLTEGALCRGDTTDLLVFGEHLTWMSPPMICGPGLACAKDMPGYPGPMCVQIKSEVYPCTQAWPVCGGRPSPPVKNDNDLDWEKWSASPACASNVTCRTPASGGFDRKMMEACASKYLVHGLNGENYAFLGTADTAHWLGSRSETAGSLQDELEHTEMSDSGTQGKETVTASVGLYDMSIQDKAVLAEALNRALKPLWPYPVCDKDTTAHCTEFPLRKLDPDEVESALGKHPSSYFCMWGVAHTIFENGAADLSVEQVKASNELIRLYLEGHSCQVCRTNFDHLVNHFGTPTASARSEHADWWWKAHNAANEHVYSVHSYPSVLAPRVGDFANPVHMSAWYLPRETARQTWKIRS